MPQTIPKLIPGQESVTIAENIKALIQAGFPELQASILAQKYASKQIVPGPTQAQMDFDNDLYARADDASVKKLGMANRRPKTPEMYDIELPSQKAK